MPKNKTKNQYRTRATIAVATFAAIFIFAIAFFSSNRDLSIDVAPVSTVLVQPQSKIDENLRKSIDCKMEWIQSAKESRKRNKIVLTNEYKSCSKSLSPEDLKLMTESIQKIADGADTIPTSAGPIDVKKLLEAPISKEPSPEELQTKSPSVEKFQLEDLKTTEEKVTRIRGFQTIHQQRDCVTAVLRSAFISLVDKKQTIAPGASPCFIKGGLSEGNQKLAKKFIEDAANQKSASTWYGQEIKLTQDNLIHLIEHVDELLPDTFPIKK